MKKNLFAHFVRTCFRKVNMNKDKTVASVDVGAMGCIYIVYQRSCSFELYDRSVV